MPSFLVKDCIGAFAFPLCILFNLVLETTTFPTIWKIAKLCPVLKSGEPNDVLNYRAISIISNFAKLLEIILYKDIYSNIRNILSPCQHGFVERRSTTTNLASFTEFTVKILDTGGQVDVLYTDIQKAFDQIDHYILLSKLDKIGISSNLLKLFESYLLNREQYVSYNGYKSNSFISTSGVPQGSNLGPLLFLIFIDDLINLLDTDRLMFADDLKIYTSISTLEDCLNLQSNLNKVNQWCDLNKLKLNVSKCKIVTFTRKIIPIMYNYSINNDLLTRCMEIRDLGICFDSSLSFGKHVDTICKSASKMLGFIIRNSQSFNTVVCLKTLYFVYVRSRLEYGALIWYPIYACHKNRIEAIQRKFLKYLSYRVDLTYPPQGTDHDLLLNRFDLLSLSTRRVNLSLTFLHKLLHGHIDCPELLSEINFAVPRLSSRHPMTFKLNSARTNLMLRSPINTMCTNYNNLDRNCDINACDIKSILYCVNSEE